MTDRDNLIRSLGTITLEAGWIDVCGDLGDLLDGLLAAGWRVPTCTQHEIGLAPDGRLWCHRCGMRLDAVDR